LSNQNNLSVMTLPCHRLKIREPENQIANSEIMLEYHGAWTGVKG
jgi:hypothetical protein